ncbi:methionine ABC transporter permease [Gulosibacter molinativorax]|uniref:ABC transporter permease n=1 Tax=Gulosibacter molinativorax TaxID=256821 RepID=A0ABT7C8X9_9MICO|nr:methionine ABC transporter permease [Gulosibacter molinativorax]MDJ1371658.1 ABC transporter permease [Gulosibacter molinativorax]QUY63080.1 Methionine import system permease protein MetP [Gulosibacter molinativorax]
MQDQIDRLIELLPQLPGELATTLILVAMAMLLGGILGLILGVALYATRAGNILENKFIFNILNVIVNIFRPIPFIILLAALQPFARAIIGIGIGNQMAIFAMTFAATFGISRLVEQALVTVPPGVVEAARASGAGRFRTLLTVVIPEGLGPLILGYTYAFVAVIDMSAVAGYVGGEGLGNFAIQYGYRQFNPWVTWAAVIIIIIVVQIVQFLGNWLARKAMRR